MHRRIGAVSYLNTKPLIQGLRERLPDCSLEFDLPSRLADRLNTDDLDIALIPSAEFLRSPNAHIVSDACIACKGPVRSVRLLFRKPPAEIQSLALDEGSRTSAVLAQVLLQKQFSIRPTIGQLDINSDLETIDTDALLVIGDRAMDVGSDKYVESWDLGQRWFELTQLPFVFAMWVSHNSSESQSVINALQNSRDDGLANAEALSHRFCNVYGITQCDCLTYFRQQLHFHLGQRELEGLELFRQWAIEFNLLPASCAPLSLETL